MKAQILREVPWDSIIDLADTLGESGLSDEQVAKEIADFLDLVLDFKLIVKGPAGELLEHVDGHILFAAINIIIKISKNGKDKRKTKRLKKIDNIKKVLMPNFKK